MKSHCIVCYRDFDLKNLEDWTLPDGEDIRACSICYSRLYASREGLESEDKEEREEARSERALVAVEKIADAFANLATLDINIHHHKAD